MVHLEVQAGRDPSLPRRLLRYNVLLEHRHLLPVLSVAVLLRREADHPGLTGDLVRSLPEGRSYLSFRYVVLRIWEQPLDLILNGPLGTLPLAPLCDVDPSRYPEVIRRLEHRFRTEAEPEESQRLLASTRLLLTLRIPRDQANDQLRGVDHMPRPIIHGLEETWIYQEILQREIDLGKINEGQQVVLLQGRIRFGPPSRNRQVSGIDRRPRTASSALLTNSCRFDMGSVA